MFKVNDRVYTVSNGWGTVISTTNHIGLYPVKVKYDKTRDEGNFTSEGRKLCDDIHPTLFFEEIPIPESALRPRIIVSAKEVEYYQIVSENGEVRVCKNILILMMVCFSIVGTTLKLKRKL
ncbi:MAG: hypothetical protein ACRC6B_07105 [Fusobacteriaceae bacterium]